MYFLNSGEFAFTARKILYIMFYGFILQGIIFRVVFQSLPYFSIYSYFVSANEKRYELFSWKW